MAVLLETSKGDMVIDLFTDECPLASKNFLKLCKMKYYNDVLFWNVQKGFIAQSGDPTGTGKGGSSIYGILYGEQARLFEDEIYPHLKHKKKGTVGMASGGKDTNASQFYITTAADLDSLDEKHTVFGEVSEGLDVLDKIDDAFVDDKGRPLQNIRIRHTIILDDPFDDPPQLSDHIPDRSPSPVILEGDTRLEDDWVPDEDKRTAEEIEESNRQTEAQNRAVVLEMIGDLPEADSKPPTNMLFVCKLNPVTTEEDLEIIFSRFGKITSCDIIRDHKTGDSLCYAFIGFDTDKASEEAYFKMNNVLIDDRRIKVDFSQSVHHLWRQFKRFGAKADAAAGEAAHAGIHGQGGACFACGEFGHMARECPNAGGKGDTSAATANGSALQLKAAHQRPMQHGGGEQRYGLVMDSGMDHLHDRPGPTGRSHHRSERHDRGDDRSHREHGSRDGGRHRDSDQRRQRERRDASLDQLRSADRGGSRHVSRDGRDGSSRHAERDSVTEHDHHKSRGDGEHPRSEQHKRVADRSSEDRERRQRLDSDDDDYGSGRHKKKHKKHHKHADGGKEHKSHRSHRD